MRIRILREPSLPACTPLTLVQTRHPRPPLHHQVGNTAGTLAGLIAVPVTGWVLHHTGSWALAFSLAAAHNGGRKRALGNDGGWLCSCVSRGVERPPETNQLKATNPPSNQQSIKPVVGAALWARWVGDVRLREDGGANESDFVAALAAGNAKNGSSSGGGGGPREKLA
jgi:hypothetical protein